MKKAPAFRPEPQGVRDASGRLPAGATLLHPSQRPTGRAGCRRATRCRCRQARSARPSLACNQPRVQCLARLLRRAKSLRASCQSSGFPSAVHALKIARIPARGGSPGVLHGSSRVQACGAALAHCQRLAKKARGRLRASVARVLGHLRTTSTTSAASRPARMAVPKSATHCTKSMPLPCPHGACGSRPQSATGTL